MHETARIGPPGDGGDDPARLREPGEERLDIGARNWRCGGWAGHARQSMLPKSGNRFSENSMLNSLQSITFVPFD
jgi:hypothetical protein